MYDWYQRILDLPTDRWDSALQETDLDEAALLELRTLLQAFKSQLASSSTPLLEGMLSGADDLVGTTLGAYRVTDCLSRAGGMGTLYRAERADGTYSRPVAIKVVRQGLDTERFVRRFHAERRILALLAHPGIVSLIDAGATPGGRPFFVMELIDGGLPLDQYSDRHNLPIAERLALFQQVCRAVAHAHARLIVHRDLKPGNILVTPEGQVKLLDFGLAKLVSDEGDALMPTTTMAGERFLTPEYASPEQVRGEPAFLTSDVYSLGVVLYELLTGRRPYAFTARTPAEISRLVCDIEPQRPSTAVLSAVTQSTAGASPAAADAAQRSQALRGDLDAIVLKAMRKDTQGRYSSVTALAADIDRHTAGLPVEARSGTFVYVASRFARRHGFAIGAAGLITLSLVAGVVATRRQALAAEAARLDAETQRVTAQRRFEDVRSVATSFIFDIHDAIADLPGATPARQMVVGKGLSFLDALAKDAEGDAGLRLELAEAYLRMGAIQGAPFASNTGDVPASLESLQKALRLVESTDTASASDVRVQAARARAREGIADALFANGRSAEAVTHLRDAITIRRSLLRSQPDNLAHVDNIARGNARLCVLLLPLGDVSGAIDACVEARTSFDRLLAAKPADRALSRAAAMSDSAHGNALRLSGRPADARESFARSVSRLRALVETDPVDATSRQNLATVLVQSANNLAALQDWTASSDAYEEAVTMLDALRGRDPHNERLSSVLAFVLMRRSPTLAKAGMHDAALASTTRGLAMSEALATRAGAGPTEKNEHANWLLTCEPVALRDPQRALRFIQAAVAAAPDNPVYLDTLALAYYQTGRHAMAIETAEKALGLLSPSTSGAPAAGLRGEIERHLAMFREGR